MLDLVLSQNALWVHLASALYVIGFWVRDQLLLRSTVFVGTIFYIIYYYYAADVPLWSAIAWSTVLGVVNLFVTIQIAFERTTFRMSKDEKLLYGAFGALTPGEFRKLIEPAIWHEVKKPTLLTREDAPNESLFYIIDGSVRLQKNGRSFRRTAGTFVGEVSYLLGSNATATAHAAKKARFIEWRHKDLLEVESRHPSIRVALRDILNADLAAKVADGAGGAEGIVGDPGQGGGLSIERDAIISQLDPRRLSTT